MTTTFVILGVTIVLFVWGRWSPDLVALLSLLALALSGVIGTRDALAGFGNPTVVMIAALFVVVMAGTALLSAFISNTGTVATLLPALYWLFGQRGAEAARTEVS